MIQTMIVNDRRHAILICDGCGLRIEKASHGLVIANQDGTVQFRHRHNINTACELPGEAWVTMIDFFDQMIHDLQEPDFKSIFALETGINLDGENEGKSAIEKGVAHLVPDTESDSVRIMRLWALCQLDYPTRKGSMGAVAAEQLRKIIGSEAFIALFQITGFCLAKPSRIDMLKLLKE